MNNFPTIKEKQKAIEEAKRMLLTGEERAVIREALYRQAEQYIELARTKLKFDGKPKKGCTMLVPYYFEKADLLIAVASRIKI